MRRKPRFLLFKVVSVSHAVEIRSTPKLLCRAILPYLTPRIPHKIVSTPSKDLKHLFTDSLQKGMPCFQSWAFTLCSFGQDASPTTVMHVVMFLGVVKERSRTLVWLGIGFIPLQTSEYIQRTTKTYILKNSRRFLNLQLDHNIGLIFQHLENLDHFELRGRRSGSTSCMSRSHYFQMYWTFSPAHTHTARCSSISQGIMETELLETLSPPNICPQWWKRITKIDSRHEDQYFCGGKLSTTSPISSRRLHLSNKPITGSVASVCVLLGTGCYFLPIAWRTTTWKMGNWEEHLHLRTAWWMDWTSCYLLSSILIP